jgi:hypothetical protein
MTLNLFCRWTARVYKFIASGTRKCQCRILLAPRLTLVPTCIHSDYLGHSPIGHWRSPWRQIHTSNKIIEKRAMSAWVRSRHVRCTSSCPLWAKSGLMQRSKTDHFVGASEHFGPADQPGSMPFALITASAAGLARNLMNAMAAAASLLPPDAAAEK